MLSLLTKYNFNLNRAWFAQYQPVRIIVILASTHLCHIHCAIAVKRANIPDKIFSHQEILGFHML